MKLKYSIEDFQTYMLDAIPLWNEHTKEVALSSMKGKRKFSPDIKKYFQLESQSLLPVFTVREEETDKLVGYAVFMITTPMHYKETVYAVNDALYFSPEIRKGSAGIKFMKWCENQLVVLSNGLVKVVQWRTKAEHNFGKVLEHLGYSEDDIVYTKWVGE